MLKPDFPMLSITTLATPHHGSANADYAVNARSVNGLLSSNSTRVQLARTVPTNIGHQSLTSVYGRKLEGQNLWRLKNKRKLNVNGQERDVMYYSLTADANLDSSSGLFGPTINFSETIGANAGDDRPHPPQYSYVTDSVWASTVQAVYRLLFEVEEAVVQKRNDIFGRPVNVLIEIRAGPFLNDFLVTLESGRVAGLFQEIASVKANHTSIANPSTGLTVLNAIRTADPVR